MKAFLVGMALGLLVAIASCGGGGGGGGVGVDRPVAAGQLPVLLIAGDSLAAPEYTSWPQQLRAALAPAAFVNAARGGTTAQDAADGYAAGLRPLARPGGLLVVFAGTNDMVGGRAPAQVLASLQQLAREARLDGLQVVLATVAGGAPWCVDQGACEAARSELNRLIVASAAAGGHQVLQVDQMFPNTADPANFQPDRLHWTPAAGQAIAAALQQLQAQPVFATTLEQP